MKNHCNRAHRGNSGGCEYGGNKRYNYGFMSGTASFCRFNLRWLHDFSGCPKDDTKLAVQMADAFEKLITPEPTSG